MFTGLFPNRIVPTGSPLRSVARHRAMRSVPGLRRGFTAITLMLLAAFLSADEGMWTLDNLPHEPLRARFSFEPDEAFLRTATDATVRLAGGCTGSFVSPRGLVLTNHHCVIGCVQALSTPQDDLVDTGFIARRRAQERQCPGMEINRLESTRDVTAEVDAATRGLAGQAYSDARKAIFARLQNACAGDDARHRRCDVVELYQGAVVHLYQYRRYPDVRLVFAPEFAAGFFGGDPDNFNFPRFNLDMGFLRVYEGGKPVVPPAFFPLRERGADEGELVMTLGHPGSTERLLTVAQLELRRDHLLPFELMLESEYRGLLTRYSQEGPEQARIARSDLTLLENGLKVMRGQHQALVAAEVMASKRSEENDLRNWVRKDAARRAAIGDPWLTLESASAKLRELYREYLLIEAGFGFRSELVGHARRLVRGTAEKVKPADERLEGYADADWPALTQRLAAPRPVYPDYEVLRLAWSIGKLREILGVDHPFVREVIGQESPESIARQISEGSGLADPAIRMQLWEEGDKAVDASTDPAIRLARIIDAFGRSLNLAWRTHVEAPEKQAAKALADARFARYGTAVYPDATFSLRLSFGTVQGWMEAGRPVAPWTTFSGLWSRATPHEPFRLAPRWERARDRIDATRRFNQVTTNDITGGNSGSPMINRKGEIVGLVFDGNSHSIGGTFFYDPNRNRAVSVHPQAMITALREVYDAPMLLREITIH